MSIGTSIVRTPRSGRGASKSSSLREVCLIGVDRRLRRRVEAWAPGAEVQWLGRTYEVRAADTRGKDAVTVERPARRYVHLSARTED